MKKSENYYKKQYHFVRRYLELNFKDKSFSVLKDKLYEIEGENIDDALEKLVEQLNHKEGTDGLIPNDGYPKHIITKEDRHMYASRYFLAMFCFQEEANDNKNILEVTKFIDILKEFEGFTEDHLYKGFYANEDFSSPRLLVVHRINCHNNVLDYLFYPEKGKYKGELEKYLYFENQIYCGNEEDISKLHFEVGQTGDFKY